MMGKERVKLRKKQVFCSLSPEDGSDLNKVLWPYDKMHIAWKTKEERKGERKGKDQSRQEGMHFSEDDALRTKMFLWV